jgi:hypothetical protein
LPPPVNVLKSDRDELSGSGVDCQNERMNPTIVTSITTAPIAAAAMWNM